MASAWQTPPVVLVVDDNVLNLTLYEMFLRREGYTVRLLSDGDTVVEVARECRPTLILMDIWMPGTSGIDAVKQLKACAETRDIPVFAVTALNPDEDANLPPGSGFAGVLRKPATLHSLKATVESVLAGGNAAWPATAEG